MSEEGLNRGERSQAQILQAAHRLFLQKGYHGTSMRQISQAAGIALGSIYNHFASKEEIFIQVLLEQHPFYEVFPAMVAAQGDTIEAFVRDAARRMLARFDDRMEFLNLMFIELVEFNGQHIPQIFQMMYPQVLEFAHRFTEGQEALRPIPLPIIIRAFIGLFFSYILTELLLARQMPTEMQEDALEHFVNIYLHGILAEQA
jgi:AcrR family transcriptional regulator